MTVIVILIMLFFWLVMLVRLGGRLRTRGVQIGGKVDMLGFKSRAIIVASVSMLYKRPLPVRLLNETYGMTVYIYILLLYFILLNNMHIYYNK